MQSVKDLIDRCSVLLTVEQLMQLVRQMQEEQRRQQAHASRSMLQKLSRQTQDSAPEPEPPTSESATGGTQWIHSVELGFTA